MSKELSPLEAFQKLKGYIPLDWEETKLVEKSLKALEIIKDIINNDEENDYKSLLFYSLEALADIRNESREETISKGDLLKEVLL